MRPRRRYVKGNAGTEGPTNLLFFDTESKRPRDLPDGSGFTLSLRLWCATHVRREGETWTRQRDYDGTRGADLWDLVEALADWHRPLWVFAHNLGFDLTQAGFWRELERRRFTAGPVARGPSPKTGKPRRPWLGRLVLEGRPTFLVVRCRNGVVRFVDTGNYWPTSLARIGGRHGLAKLPMPGWDAPRDEWVAYCRRDVDVVRLAVTELLSWWVREGCGVFKMTAPALAMTNFKHTGQCRTADGKALNIVLDDQSPARELERGAYLGGRIEPFYLGTAPGPVYALDVNSLYLSVMAGRLFPRRRVRRLWEVTPDRLRQVMRSYGAIADVLIDTGPTSRSYPLRTAKCQLHCSGRFWTTLCGPELLRALNEGDVMRVGEAHVYSMAELFKGWAVRWFERKRAAQLAGDFGQAEFAKLIGTSLSGKFGQKGDWWVDTTERLPRKGWGYSTVIDDTTDTVTRYRYVGGHVQKRVTGKEPAEAFPAISAYVTGYARERMRSLIATCPPRTVLYMATDSLLVLQPGYDALKKAGEIDPEALGKLRVEGVYKEAEVCGPNWYRLDDCWTISGMHGRAVEGPDGRPVAEVWDQLPGVLSGRPGDTWTVRRYQLADQRATLKNDPASDGWRKPFHLRPDSDYSSHPPRLVLGPVLPE